MARARVDSSIQRHTATIQGGGIFEFPLGVYPVEPLTPVEGYTLAFEAADDDPPEGQRNWGPGGGSGMGGGRPEPTGSSKSDEPWNEADEPDGSEDPDDEPPPYDDPEPWPDRYVFDINIRASRLEALCRQLFAMMPGRIFPILDVMGNDAYREIDPYIAYDLVGVERFLDTVRRFRAWFFEDGMVGFGAMSEEPFFYAFIDEHKILTVRVPAPAKEHVEKILRAFDLNQVEKIAGADAAVHEHRGVLDAPGNRPDLLTHDELVEQVRDDWGLQLNVDPFSNLDEQGVALGIVPWRTVVRVFDEGGEVRYAEAFVTADSLQYAGELAVNAVETLLDAEELDPLAIPKSPSSSSDPLSPLPPGTTTDRPSPSTDDLGITSGQIVESDLTEPELSSPDQGWEKDSDEPDDLPGIPLDDLNLNMEEFDVVVADRIRIEDIDQFPALSGQNRANMKNRKVISARWLQ